MPRLPQTANAQIRPVQYRDLDAIDQLTQQSPEHELPHCSAVREKSVSIRNWYGVMKLLSLFPNPLQNLPCVHVAELNQRIQGMIQVSPFNRTRSTWRVDRVVVAPAIVESEGAEAQVMTQVDIGSLLIRFCLERIWQARTWVLEIDVNDKAALDLYRHNGFQPLANMTYWSISPEQLEELAEREPDLPNLLPVSNADAQLLYQLDTMAMPPLVRQVFDRHVQDFKVSVFGSLVEWAKQVFTRTEVVGGYVFEPQRKAAIGYFQLHLCRDGSQPHIAHLTVNPAYTWLYPELMAQMARIMQELPAQSLQMASPDYQPEREEYLDSIGAERIGHTLLMSRSVWHKVRETKSIAEGLQLAEMLQNLQPSRKPVPGRISMLKSVKLPAPEKAQEADKSTPKSVQELMKAASQEPHREDPCC
ncbi:GNAT family N-acetyltransferase [Cyanobacteria bacterium FACHB-63]|nr:GNAT family N-acetyltransferase [Cyanobacteria bacterium FACHB-63]